MLALADWCDDNGECYPGMTKIAQKSRVSKRSAQNNIESLENAGEVVVVELEGMSTKNGQRTNRYYLKAYRDALGLPTPEGRRGAAHDTPAQDEGVQPTARQGVQPTAPKPSVEPSVITLPAEERPAATPPEAPKPQRHTVNANGRLTALALEDAHWYLLAYGLRHAHGHVFAHKGNAAYASALVDVGCLEKLKTRYRLTEVGRRKAAQCPPEILGNVDRALALKATRASLTPKPRKPRAKKRAGVSPEIAGIYTEFFATWGGLPETLTDKEHNDRVMMAWQIKRAHGSAADVRAVWEYARAKGWEGTTVWACANHLTAARQWQKNQRQEVEHFDLPAPAPLDARVGVLR